MIPTPRRSRWEGVTGGERRDSAIEHLQQRLPINILRIARAYLQLLLAEPDGASIDAVRPLVTLPPGLAPTVFGAAVSHLRSEGVIMVAGIITSPRPEAHSRLTRTWRITARSAAQAWLTANPVPEAPPPRLGNQFLLFGTEV